MKNRRGDQVEKAQKYEGAQIFSQHHSAKIEKVTWGESGGFSSQQLKLKGDRQQPPAVVGIVDFDTVTCGSEGNGGDLSEEIVKAS